MAIRLPNGSIQGVDEATLWPAQVRVRLPLSRKKDFLVTFLNERMEMLVDQQRIQAWDFNTGSIVTTDSGEAVEYYVRAVPGVSGDRFVVEDLKTWIGPGVAAHQGTLVPGAGMTWARMIEKFGSVDGCRVHLEFESISSRIYLAILEEEPGTMEGAGLQKAVLSHFYFFLRAFDIDRSTRTELLRSWMWFLYRDHRDQKSAFDKLDATAAEFLRNDGIIVFLGALDRGEWIIHRRILKEAEPMVRELGRRYWRAPEGELSPTLAVWNNLMHQQLLRLGATNRIEAVLILLVAHYHSISLDSEGGSGR